MLAWRKVELHKVAVSQSQPGIHLPRINQTQNYHHVFG